MVKKSINTDIFGFIKPSVDVHTMGVYTIVNLLRDCGFKAYIATEDVNIAAEDIRKINNYSLIKQWITSNNINNLGFSYRLEPNEGLT